MNYYCFGNRATPASSSLSHTKASCQGRDIPTEHYKALATDKYCKYIYQVIFINIDICSIKKVPSDYEKH